MRFRFKHKWLRFSLRSVLIGLTLACIWLGWQAHLVHQRKSLREWLTWRDAHFELDPVRHRFLSGAQTPPGSHEITWLRRQMGDTDVFGFRLPIEIPQAESQRIAKTFPEAIVRQVGGPDPIEFQCDDKEYAKIKNRRAIRSQRVAAFYTTIIPANGEPPMADLLMAAPWLADDLVESASLMVDAHAYDAEFAVRAILVAAELRMQLAPATSTADEQANVADLAKHLRKLQAILRATTATSANQRLAREDTEDLLISCELERCAAELARSNRNTTEEADALDRAVTAADRLREIAYRAQDENKISLFSLTDVLRRVWQAKAARAKSANDAAGERQALLDYGSSLEVIRRRTEALFQVGAKGGEAENLYHICYCAAEQAAFLAKMDAYRDAEITAWRTASQHAGLAETIGHVSFGGYISSSEDHANWLEPVMQCAEARIRLARLEEDVAGEQAARREQANRLLQTLRKVTALRMVGAKGGETEICDYEACQYILARIRPAE